MKWRGRFVLAGTALLLLTFACGGAAVNDGGGSADTKCLVDGGTVCANTEAKPDRVCKAPTALQSPPCPVGYYLYADSIGGPGPMGVYSSDPIGDLLCHQTCETDADCSDPCHPSCHTLGLFSGGDWNCNGKVRVCGTRTRDDC